MNQKVLVLDHVAYDVDVYGSPKVIFKRDMPGNFISNFSYSQNSLDVKNNLDKFIERISKLLLKACLENPELTKRYLGRGKIGINEKGGSAIELFTCLQKDDTYVFTSEIFGVEVNMTDTGKNFIFSALSYNSNDKHEILQGLLEEVNPLWKSFTKEITIGVKHIDFTNEKNDLYGYSPHKIATSILKYLPITDNYVGFGLSAEGVMNSFHSMDNDGLLIFNVYGIDVFFRLNIQGSLEISRQATAVKVLDDKILMRQATPMAELIIRSSFTPFHLSNQSFDYADEQNNMNRVARIIHLGLSQWAEGDFERLGKDIE